MMGVTTRQDASTIVQYSTHVLHYSGKWSRAWQFICSSGKKWYFRWFWRIAIAINIYLLNELWINDDSILNGFQIGGHIILNMVFRAKRLENWKRAFSLSFTIFSIIKRHVFELFCTDFPDTRKTLTHTYFQKKITSLNFSDVRYLRHNDNHV